MCINRNDGHVKGYGVFKLLFSRENGAISIFISLNLITFAVVTCLYSKFIYAHRENLFH